MAILGGDSVSSSSSLATNQISFNPIITALTGTGAASPYVDAPQTMVPTSTSTATQSNPASLQVPLPGSMGSLGGTTTPRSAIGAGQYVPTSDPNGVKLGVTTNPQTMIWMLLFGGFALIMLTGGGGGGRRR
ncbi:hypothetical protein [Paramagnetospirillum marisnigri]|uniref:hypothetical protein n=1 Tax=Paramagnetospirillum marisnigri TaxID=1285242 RepID=UPI0009EF20B9|nr:hypothetical protein [Paramagnetospirillum marisnigri]